MKPNHGSTLTFFKKLVALWATKPHDLVARRRILFAQNIRYKQIKSSYIRKTGTFSLTFLNIHIQS